MRDKRIASVVLLLTALLVGFSGVAWGQDLQDYLDEGLQKYNRSEFRGALEKWKQGLELARKMDDSVAVSTFLRNVGLVYEELGDYTRALSYDEQALKIDKQISNLKGETRSLNNIGIVCWYLQDYPKAYSTYEQAITISRQIGDRESEGEILANMGLVDQDLGHYSKALCCFEQALKICEEVSNHQGEAFLINNIGVLYYKLGDYDRTLSFYEQALELCRQITDRRGEAAILNNIGSIYELLGDYSKALSLCKQALEMGREMDLATTVSLRELHIGNIYLELGKLTEALSLFERNNAFINLGRYYLRTGEYLRAWERFAKSLEIDETKRPANSLLADYVGLGLALEGLVDNSGASAYYRKAVDFIEHQRESLTEHQRRHFFGGKVLGFSLLEPYEGLVRIHFKTGQLKECFFYTEHTKSRVFLDAIVKRYGGTLKIPKELSQQEEELTNKVASLYKQQEIAFLKGNQERFKEIEGELKPLKEEQKRFTASLRNSYPEYTSLRYPQPIGVDEIALHEDELLLEYEVTDKETIALLVKKGSILKAISIPMTRDSLEELVKQYRGFTQAKTYSDLYTYDPKLGARLYTLLIKDLAPLLSRDKKLIIIPDEILGILPFEMLVSEMPKQVQMVDTKVGPYPKGVRYFGDDYQISYYQSATSLTTIRSLKKVAAEKPLFALADPVFDSTDTRLTGETRVNPTGEYQVSVMGAVKEEWKKNTDSAQVVFPRLERTGEVAERLQQSFGKGVKVLTGLAASENEVRREKLDKYRYLLFATHGILDNTLPYIKEPALVLTQVESDEAESPATGIMSKVWQFIKSILNWLGLMKKEVSTEEVSQEDPTPGFLTLSEVMDMRVGGEVVALTACNTGLGKNLTGEGVMGLGRAFQYAGARAVLMSLWSVEDESTNLLTERFFNYLKQGKDKLEALRLARSDLRKAGYEHPYYWAPFILVGER